MIVALTLLGYAALLLTAGAAALAKARWAERAPRLAVAAWLALTGRHDERYGAVLLDHDEAAAWCLPGAARHVVLTTAAVQALDGVQLAAPFRQGHEQVARLVELLADDAATLSRG